MTPSDTRPAISTRDPRWRWRWVIWGVPAILLVIPAVAMRFTAEVSWTGSDFAVMGALLATAAGAIDALTARAGDTMWKAAATLTVLGLFLLVWINLAVGMIGDEGDPANRMFAGVIATIFAGGFVSRLRPSGMTFTMIAAALLQAGIAALALLLGWGADARGWPLDVIGTGAIFTTIWLAAAAAYRVARVR